MTETNPFGGPRYGKNYLAHKYAVPVLAVLKLSTSEKEAIRALIKPITTGLEAEQFIFEKVAVAPSQSMIARHEQGWSFIWLDQLHRAGVLRLKGIEVCLFYKRQVIEEEPAPGEPLPEGILKEPSDAWQRLDLLGRSAREANLFLKQKHESLNQSTVILQQQVQANKVIADAAETAQHKAEEEEAKARKFAAQLQEKLGVIQAHVGGLKIRKWMDAHQKEKDRLAKKKQRVDARKKAVAKELQAKELKKLDRLKRAELKKKAAEKRAKAKAKKAKAKK